MADPPRSQSAAESRPARARHALVRTVKVVRYTDFLPSALAFEIDAHELCHAIAAFQTIPDPCHVGNEGLAQSSSPERSAMQRP